MKLPRLVLTVSTGLIAAVAAVAALSADKPPAIKPSLAQPDRRAAPSQLSAAIRTARTKAALKAGGFASLGSALSGPRLTPIAPAHSSGAAITYAGPGVFLGADADEPDGAFLLQHSSVQMRFPTTAQKVYVLTCSFELIGHAERVQDGERERPEEHTDDPAPRLGPGESQKPTQLVAQGSLSHFACHRPP
jgi:hypothetical protein